MKQWNEFTFEVSETALRLCNLQQFPHDLTYSLIPSQFEAKKVFDFIRTFSANPGRSFLITGGCNSGKTVAGICMIKQLVAAQRGWGVYMSLPEMMDYKIQGTKVTPGQPETYWDECFNTDLLVVDDIGYEEFSSDHAGKMLLRLLKSRSDTRKSTIFLSQFQPLQLKNKYGDLFGQNLKAKMELILLEGSK